MDDNPRPPFPRTYLLTLRYTCRCLVGISDPLLRYNRAIQTTQLLGKDAPWVRGWCVSAFYRAMVDYPVRKLTHADGGDRHEDPPEKAHSGTPCSGVTSAPWDFVMSTAKVRWWKDLTVLR